MNEEEQLKSSFGLVAFFDILGYKQIIANNEIKEAASIVKRILKTVTEFRKADDKLKNVKIVPSISYLVFSDSILAYSIYPQNEARRESEARVFALICSTLCYELFEAGLPVRGAIAKGEFFIEEYSFAGKAIIEAYEFANAMEMAGCVVIPTAETEFADCDRLFPYSVPLKGNQKQTLLALNPSYDGFAPEYLEAPRRFTIDRFSRHNKSISPDVIGKVNNTVHFLEQARVDAENKGLKIEQTNEQTT